MQFGIIKSIPKPVIEALKPHFFDCLALEGIEENSQIQSLCVLMEAHSTGHNYHGLCSLLFYLRAVLMICTIEPIWLFLSCFPAKIASCGKMRVWLHRKACRLQKKAITGEADSREVLVGRAAPGIN